MYRRLGDHIRLVNKKNKDLEIQRLLGVNIDNEFMPSIANVAKEKLVKYKIIEKNQFATNIMHVGRDERLPIALYEEEKKAIVSPAYKVFEVKDESDLYPEYLMIEFQRPEFDRKAWFFCDSSVRGGLDWDRFCDIEIPIPPIEKQKKYVDVYRGLRSNKEAYDESLDDLQTVCKSFMNSLRDFEDTRYLGEVINSFSNKNKNGEVNNLLGVNIEKEFIPSKANVSGKKLHKYKVIEKGDFATNTMHVGRDRVLPVALYNKSQKSIVSPAYKTFRLKEQVKCLIPEFLMLWFYRPEFDRQAWFFCDSSVRGGLNWDRFCEIEIPVPSIEVQEAIVTIYHSLKTRKKISKQINEIIKPLSPVLMKGAMKEIEELNAELV